MKNFMIFLFSRQKRLNMAYIFIALNILQVLGGCFMTGGSIYICLSVTKHLYSEKSEIRFVFAVFALFGTHIIIQYLIGIKIVEKCFVKAHKRSTKRTLYIWIIACSNTILDLLVLATMIVKISKHIIRSIRHSMEKGMRHYLTDPVWKHTMDRWQFSLRCCGVNDFRDWYMISWLDKYHINVDNPNVHSLLLSKDHLHLPVTPWSCCNVDFPMQCFHDPIQQIESAHVWKEQAEFPEMSLNHVGCLEAIRYPIEMALVIFLVLCIILILVQVAIIIIARFLYTSCRNSVILRDTQGDSPGWLFGRDCLADKRGRSLPEVMRDLQHESESSFEQEDEVEESENETHFLKTKAHERTITSTRRKKSHKERETNQESHRRKSQVVKHKHSESRPHRKSSGNRERLKLLSDQKLPHTTEMAQHEERFPIPASLASLGDLTDSINKSVMRYDEPRNKAKERKSKDKQFLHSDHRRSSDLKGAYNPGQVTKNKSIQHNIIPTKQSHLKHVETSTSMSNSPEAKRIANPALPDRDYDIHFTHSELDFMREHKLTDRQQLMNEVRSAETTSWLGPPLTATASEVTYMNESSRESVCAPVSSGTEAALMLR